MAARKKSSNSRTARKASGSTKAVAKKPVAKTAKRKSAAAKAKKAASAKPAGKKKAARKAAARKGARAKPAGRKTPARRKAAGRAAEKPTFPEVEALAELMDRHGLLEVSYEREADGSTAIHVVRAGAYEAMAGLPSAPLAAPAPAPAAASAVAAPPAAATEVPAADAPAETLHAFKSPMVGTFYRASSPEATPFVTAGDSVDPNAVVCIIEAMKVMNEITPDVGGEVVSIEVENGEAVEFGQTLMLLRPR